jgi:hypothetical protein
MITTGLFAFKLTVITKLNKLLPTWILTQVWI